MSLQMGKNQPDSEPDDLTSSLRKRVDIQEHDTTTAWRTIASRVPASISPGKGFSFVHGEMNYPMQYAMIRVRYRPGLYIYSHMRILYIGAWGTRIFPVISASIPEEWRRSIVLTCHELQSVGPAV